MWAVSPGLCAMPVASRASLAIFLHVGLAGPRVEKSHYGHAHWGRVARVARILRVPPGVRAMKIVGEVILSRRGESAFLAASLVVILLIVLGSLSMLQFETVDVSNIRTAEEALSWAVTTITTVGYGTGLRVTTEGCFVAALLMCAGVCLFGT